MSNSIIRPTRFINISLAGLWCYQGLIPKLIFTNSDEIAIWQVLSFTHHVAVFAVKASGIAEIIFGLCFLFFSFKFLHILNIAGLIGLFILITLLMPMQLTQAFNPVIMNFAMISLSTTYLMLSQQNKQ